MRILAVRHGEAGDAEEYALTGQPDHLRPLTARGRELMKHAARGMIGEAGAIYILASSPYLRAVETAEILSAAHADLPIEQLAQLEPGSPPQPIVAWLAAKRTDGCIALVGHAPDLAHLITYLVSGLDTPLVKIKKGGACLVSFSGKPQSGKGMIRWLMDAKQLAKVARSDP
jgi:phosphohistidine phosphatase